MRKENLVAYNATRIKKAMETVDKDNDFSLFYDYDSVLSTLAFMKQELERNYNPKANLKCPHCKEHFRGLHAYDKQIAHKLKEHKEHCDAQMVMCFGVLACMVDNLANYKWLYEKTGSKAALTLHKLHRKGKDLPVLLLKEYSQEFDNYMDTQDPRRKWHKPSKSTYPEGVEVVAGRNTIIKETVKAISQAFLKSKTPKLSGGNG